MASTSTSAHNNNNYNNNSSRSAPALWSSQVGAAASSSALNSAGAAASVPSPPVVDAEREAFLESCGACRMRLRPDKEPLLLPCLHSVCRACLPGCAAGGSVDLHRCLICRQQFCLTEVVENYFIRESPSGSKDSGRSKVCRCCEDSAEAFSFCVQCSEWLCEACVFAHQRVKITKDHTVRTGSEGSGFERVFCSAHRQELLQLYCITCDVLTCRDCQLHFHKDHRHQFMEDAIPSQRLLLETLIMQLQERTSGVTKTVRCVRNKARDLMEMERRVRVEIKMAVQQLIKELSKRGGVLIQEVQKCTQLHQQTLQQQHSGLVKLQTQQEHVLRFGAWALNKDNSTALLLCRRTIFSQFQRALETAVSDEDSAALDIRFHWDARAWTNRIAQFGRLSSDCSPPSQKRPLKFHYLQPPPSPLRATPPGKETPPASIATPPPQGGQVPLPPPPPLQICSESTASLPVSLGHLDRTAPPAGQNKGSGLSKAPPPPVTVQAPPPPVSAQAPPPPVNAVRSYLVQNSPALQQQRQQYLVLQQLPALQTYTVQQGVVGNGTFRTYFQLVPQATPAAPPNPASSSPLQQLRTLVTTNQPPRRHGAPESQQWSRGLPSTFKEILTGGPSCSAAPRNTPPTANPVPPPAATMTPAGSPAPSGKAAANRAAAATQGSIEAPPPDSRTEADAGFSDGVINRKVPVVRLTRLVLDWKPGCKPPRFRVLSGGNGRSDALVQLQHGSVTRTSPCVSFPDSTSPPSDCEGECSSSSPSSSSVPAASSLQRPGAASEPRPGRGREERPRVEGSMHCTSCRTRGQLALCCECGRGFHAQCHVPPLLRLLSAQWKCMLCRDFSEEYKYEFSPKSETPGLSLLDQKKCSHLLLTLYCHRASPSLYKPPSPTSDLGSYVDLTLIRGRLLRKLSPSYCRPEDFVADIWLLLSNVLKHSQRSRVTRTVAVLRSSFSEKLRDTFGDALDPRYLDPEICLSISRKRGNGEVSRSENEESQSKRIRPELSEKI